MNYLSLLAIILGMISVIITLNYIKYYDSLNKNLTKLKTICSGNKLNIPGLIKIQDELNISDKRLNTILEKNSIDLVNILQKYNDNLIEDKPDDIETFSNYNYLDTNQRDLSNITFTKFIKNKPINYSSKCRIKTYMDDINHSKTKSLELGSDIKYNNNFKIMGYSTTPSKYGLIY